MPLLILRSTMLRFGHAALSTMQANAHEHSQHISPFECECGTKAYGLTDLANLTFEQLPAHRIDSCVESRGRVPLPRPKRSVKDQGSCVALSGNSLG